MQIFHLLRNPSSEGFSPEPVWARLDLSEAPLSTNRISEKISKFDQRSEKLIELIRRMTELLEEPSWRGSGSGRM